VPARRGAEEAANAFLDFCERRGMTEAEQEPIWNAMGCLYYDQVQNRHGPFSEGTSLFVAEGGA
jgi:hypothetical protein